MMIGFRARSLRLAMAAAAASFSVAGLPALASAANALLPGEYHASPSPAEVAATCPMADPEVLQCVHAAVYGGAVTLNKQSVPISVPGNTLDFGNRYNAELDQTIAVMGTKPPLNGPGEPVPGGLFGLTGRPSTTTVTASLEYAGPLVPLQPFGVPGEITFSFNNISNRTGAGVIMPVKIHLHNQFLGGSCYIGTNAEPIVMRLTTGVTAPPPPNKPIVGTPGFVEFQHGASVVRAVGAKLVDNSFPVPAASGCGAMLDKSIDLKLGLPSPAGHNAFVFLNNVWISGAEFARGEI
jgi:hypothetical protein